MLLMLTMLPEPLAATAGANAPTRRYAARTLLANMESKSSTVVFSVGPQTECPALLTSTSMSPASPAKIAASAPLPASSRLSASMLRMMRTREAPMASRTAISRPSPEVAPVTSAVRGRVVTAASVMVCSSRQRTEQDGLFSKTVQTVLVKSNRARRQDRRAAVSA